LNVTPVKGLVSTFALPRISTLSHWVGFIVHYFLYSN